MHTRAARTARVAVTTATAVLVLLSTGVAAAAPTELTVRIEGEDRTLFEGPILTDGHAVQAASDSEPRHCDATNNGSEPEPHPTPTAAAVDAMTIVGEDFDGDWYPGFDDYFVTRWGDDGQIEDDFAYWGILVDGAYTPVGGCQFANAAGDEVLWAYDAFASKPFLRLAAAADPSPAPGSTLPTAFVDQGQPLALAVKSYTGAMDGAPESIQPAASVLVAPVDTDPVKGYQEVDGADPSTVTTASDGTVSVTFATPGWHRLKATRSGFVRSNRLDVCVRAPAASDCGPLPADALVRSAIVPDPDPDPEPDPDPDSDPGTLPTHAPTSGGGTTPPPAGKGAARVRLSAPVLDRDWARARVTVRWKVLDAGAGVRSFTIESRQAGAKRWRPRASGRDSSATLKLAAGVLSRLRLTIVDALGRSATQSLGSVLVPRDERDGLSYRGPWTHSGDPDAWAKTVARGSRGATLRVRMAAGRPVLFVRNVKRAAVIELSGGDGERELFRIAPRTAKVSRAVEGARRGAGTLTVRVLSGNVGLDGVALRP